MAIVLEDQTVGATIPLKFNGVATDFLVVHQGIPSSMYDSSCTGTWLLMKDIYENRQWHSSDVNKLESSTIHSYLNSTFFSLFDASIQTEIKQVKIPYRQNSGSGGDNQSGSNGLSAKFFLLSGYEVGWTNNNSSSFPVDGAKLGYFASGTSTAANNKRIGYFNGSAAPWWLRSPNISDTYLVMTVYTGGNYDNSYCTYTNGVRPALILPSDTKLSEDGTIYNPRGVYIKQNGQWNLTYQSK